MPIFLEDNKGTLKKLNSFSVGKEKDVQQLVENNLVEVLDMHFLASEYITTFGGRIDTLAVDSNGAPVIIEYKKSRNDNIINQGLSYLRWLQAQKMEFFEMLILKKLSSNISKNIKIDWKNPRVICIAESYSKYDIDTAEVIPVRIELFKYRYYDKGIFSLEPLNVTESTTKQVTGKSIEIPTTDYTVNHHLEKAEDKIKELFLELRGKILELDENIIERTTSMYVAYRVAKNFAEIHIGKRQIKIYLRPLDYNDPLNKVDKMPDKYQWSLDRRIYLRDKKEVNYVLQQIEQSYKNVI